MHAAAGRIDDLMNWADNSGIFAPRLHAGHVDGMRGLLASKHIKKGGLLLDIPKALALSVYDGGPNPLSMFMSDADWAHGLPE